MKDGMTLHLTTDQAAQVEPMMRIGIALLGKVSRNPFDGTNAATAGTLMLELGCVPESALPALREAIRTATHPAPAKPAKVRKPSAAK